MQKAIVAAHAAEGPAAEPVGSAKGALAADNQPVQVVECVSEFKRRFVKSCIKRLQLAAQKCIRCKDF